MNCTIEVHPPNVSNSIPGLLLRYPRGVRILGPAPTGGNTILFGPTDDCRVTAPGPNGGMGFSDPRGFTFGSQVLVNGPIFAQQFIQTSSRRSKSDVKPIEQPLEKNLPAAGRAVYVERRQGWTHRRRVHRQVIPEVVSWEEDGRNARGVNYDHLVAVAIEGIKAQQSRIQTLEREKSELKESLSALQVQLDQLSRKLEMLADR